METVCFLYFEDHPQKSKISRKFVLYLAEEYVKLRMKWIGTRLGTGLYKTI